VRTWTYRHKSLHDMRTARINGASFQLRLSKAAAFVRRRFCSALVRVLSKPRLMQLETQEIPQKALSDALSSQWVDNLIADMPTKGTRGHIRELRNHLFRCYVKPKIPWITTFRFDLDSLYSMESMKFISLLLVFIKGNTMTIQFALAL